jgi:hypothetical protein
MSAPVGEIQSWYCKQCASMGILKAPMTTDVLTMTEARRKAHERKNAEC